MLGQDGYSVPWGANASMPSIMILAEPDTTLTGACKFHTCDPGKVCVPAPKQCIHIICPQYTCEEPVNDGSCLGHCGQTFEVKTGCWCDAACTANGDCCGDYADVCDEKPDALSAIIEALASINSQLQTTSDAISSKAPTSSPAEDSEPPSTLVVASCKGRCGKSAPLKSCWCDKTCVKHKDCCDDYSEVCAAPLKTNTVGVVENKPSCEGKCGKSGGQKGKKCWCDEQCISKGDCCEDYKSVCWIAPAEGAEESTNGSA